MLGATILLLASALAADPAASPAATVAQPAVTDVRQPAAGDVQPAPNQATPVIPALTPVELVIEADLGSKLSKTGDIFPIRLGTAIVIDGKEVVAAGAEGEGEVIHAKKAGGSGAAGELVLAARFVTVDDRKLKLRSMRIALAGKDAINTVDAVNAASAASPLPIGLIGFAITGRNVVVPKGTVALAKTAEAFLPYPTAAPATPAPVVSPAKEVQ